MGDEKETGKIIHSLPIDSTAIQGEHSRTLRFTGIATDSIKKQFLTFLDPNGIDGKYRIPLGRVTPAQRHQFHRCECLRTVNPHGV